MSEPVVQRGHAQAHLAPSLDRVLADTRKWIGKLRQGTNTAEAIRLVLGLLYLSRIPPAASEPGAPTWSWLLSRSARRDPRIRTDVNTCLTRCLPTVEDRDAETGVTSLAPVPPPRSERVLHALIHTIAATQQVGPLLDQCLRDLSSAQADGSNYYTPPDLARLMVGAAVPRDGHRVLDPVCGSGGLLVESHRYVRERVGLNPTMQLRGKEQHAPTSQVARMNLTVRGIEADIFPPGDSLAEPESEPHDIVLANLPFNQRGWTPEGETEPNALQPASPVPADPRWPEEPPPPGSANFAWIQHIAHALGPTGRAAFLMADTVASSRQPTHRRLRERLLRADLVECVIALPPRVFGHSTATACLWVFNKDKSPRPGWGTLDCRRQVLFINARRAFEPVPKSRARRLGDENTARILATLAAWRGLPENGVSAAPYADTVGWSRSCSAEEIANRSYSVMPTSYAVEPPGPEQDTRIRIDELKLELTDQLSQTRDVELRLLDALEEI